MTPKSEKQALKQSIEVWKYLAKHPEIMSKAELPERLYDKIKDCMARCPLCQFYDFHCRKCPLPAPANGKCTLFFKWVDFQADDNTRVSAAQRIVVLCEKRLAKISEEA